MCSRMCDERSTLVLRHWVDLPGPQSPWVMFRVVPLFLVLGLVQQLLIVLQALCGGAPHKRGNGPPLAGHHLCQMQQLLLLLLRPLGLFDAGVQPFIPPGLRSNMRESLLWVNAATVPNEPFWQTDFF